MNNQILIHNDCNRRIMLRDQTEAGPGGTHFLPHDWRGGDCRYLWVCSQSGLQRELQDSQVCTGRLVPKQQRDKAEMLSKWKKSEITDLSNITIIYSFKA